MRGYAQIFFFVLCPLISLHTLFTVSDSNNNICFRLTSCVTVGGMQSLELCSHWKRHMIGCDSCVHLLTVCLSGARDLCHLC